MLKVLVLLKRYWYIPIAIIVLVFLLLSRNTKTAEKIIDLMKKSVEKQQKEFSKIDEDKKKKQADQTKKYNEAIEKIEKQYEKDKKELDDNTKKRVKQLVKKNSDEELAKIISQEFGIKIEQG